jgi:hypothetical protein
MSDELAFLPASDDGAAFDPEQTETMGAALEAAWSFVQRCADPRDPEPEVARDMLAHGIIAAAKEGHYTKRDLANEAIRRLRAGVLGPAGDPRAARF